MEKETVFIGSDHAGFEYKEAIKKMLAEAGYRVEDVGTHSSESVDYPDYAHPVAQAVEEGKAHRGILICGSGNGVCITANKHAKVRAALCWNEEIARLARQHNDANVICLPARFVSLEEAKAMVKTFLTTGFEGGRHERRVNKIACA
ncbi:MAG: ribose 5-phosphate isomerase B [Thermonema sp.]|uniref:ribose 5-phosphate isomerase B n=1 Tax=Thermonema sp. TaxID=2231181 RepID=UPI0021DD5984|nr:ribose 5-phosphate isomerase B [Thermonema sp.]GIV39993.1 MAG: ribose 5-phosphate isomerase B [Thermonema sp.]